MKVVGYKELIAKLKRIEKEAPVAMAFGMYEGMQIVMVDAKERAPRDTTTMARSGYVTPPEVRGGAHVSIEAGFGGGSENYVTRQHEDLSLNHPNGGEAKFFERALDDKQSELEEAIFRHVQNYLKTGQTNPAAKIVPASPTEDVP